MGTYGWVHYGFTLLGFLHSLHGSKQSSPDAPLFLRLCFVLERLLPADIVMDIEVLFCFVFLSFSLRAVNLCGHARCPANAAVRYQRR